MNAGSFRGGWIAAEEEKWGYHLIRYLRVALQKSHTQLVGDVAISQPRKLNTYCCKCTDDGTTAQVSCFPPLKFHRLCALLRQYVQALASEYIENPSSKSYSRSRQGSITITHPFSTQSHCICSTKRYIFILHLLTRFHAVLLTPKAPTTVQSSMLE